MKKPALLGMTRDELTALAGELGLPRFAGRQLCEWLYQKHAGTFDAMTNLSKAARERLASAYDIGAAAPTKAQASADGTKKYLFPVAGERFVEAAWIPDRERATLCVSSQVGCKMGCLFCMTGKQGFEAQLSAGEILNQIRSLPERDTLTNIVYMGMGEPIDNLDNVLRSLQVLTADWGYGMSPRRITVSTIGIVPAMRRFIAESDCHLAVSLHSPFADERARLMPIETVYTLDDVMALLRSSDFGRQRRISFEYILFGGINDTPRHVNALARLLDGLRCRVNLIRFHPIPNTPLASAPEATVQAFREGLVSKGIRTTVRASRGQDIFAACGLLSTKALVVTEPGDY